MAKRTPHEVDKDLACERSVTGRHQEIPVDPTSLYPLTTLAAGAVLWRGDITDLDSIEVAVIHRPHYDDWSLAKGKVDPGESLSTTAAREILEETGYDIRLGKLLGHVSYPVAGRTKVVYYWTGEVLDGEFTPNEEVDEIRWLPIDEARQLLSYDVDSEVLDKAKKRFQLPATTRILYIRHGKAQPRGKWEGDDNLRPLEKKGRRQAEMLAPMLLPFKPSRVFSAEPDRCTATATPLAEEIGVETVVDPLFGDIAWFSEREAAQARFTQLIDEGGTTAVVSQGTAIPGMIHWLSENGRLPLPEELETKKGSVWVLSFNNGDLTGADYMASPLPLK